MLFIEQGFYSPVPVLVLKSSQPHVSRARGKKSHHRESSALEKGRKYFSKAIRMREDSSMALLKAYENFRIAIEKGGIKPEVSLLKETSDCLVCMLGQFDWESLIAISKLIATCPTTERLGERRALHLGFIIAQRVETKRRRMPSEDSERAEVLKQCVKLLENAEDFLPAVSSRDPQKRRILETHHSCLLDLAPLLNSSEEVYSIAIAINDLILSENPRDREQRFSRARNYAALDSIPSMEYALKEYKELLDLDSSSPLIWNANIHLILYFGVKLREGGSEDKAKGCFERAEKALLQSKLDAGISDGDQVSLYMSLYALTGRFSLLTGLLEKQYHTVEEIPFDLLYKHSWFKGFIQSEEFRTFEGIYNESYFM
jgi:tetratricopeptide (TPR) repeat protein